MEADELAAAHKRIAALEADLALTAMPASCSMNSWWYPQNADARSTGNGLHPVAAAAANRL
ncbi:hypothetical protein A5753_22625 [Mycobacterium sp. 852002-51971_SCH5477799-a]|nr:hypothetical protein A5753_22625 [Mycobacterium sp. 852002-51971_SCH5477799-a]